MAAIVSLQDISSEMFDREKCNLCASNCQNCVILAERLRTALEEIESTKLIIELLGSDSVGDGGKHSPLDDGHVNPPSNVNDISETVQSTESPDKWLTSKTKCRKKAEVKNTYHITVTNRYEHLSNLKDTQEDNVGPRIQVQDESLEIHHGEQLQNIREIDATSGTHGLGNTTAILDHNLKHQQPKLNDKTQQLGKNINKSMNDYRGFGIPTILNGKIEAKNSRMTLNRAKYKNVNNKTQKIKQHKVLLIGDSFLRGIRDNVELMTSDKFGIYSLMHPGGDLSTILQSAYKASEDLTYKDLIYVCGGTNDFNDETEGPNVENIVEFIQSNNRTNIIFANVPPRYDLSYYSQINEKIRIYNRKIAEIIHEHEKVTLMEMDTERKNHTRNGLHFSKSGKRWLSHKITTSIYAILNEMTEQGTKKVTNQEPQENLTAVKERDSSQRCTDNIKVDAKLVTQIESNNKPMDGKVNQNNANAIRISESASANSVNELIDDKGSPINVSEVELNQEVSDLKIREDKEINKNLDMEQASSTNTQCHTLDRIDETRRTSTRNKKPPSSRTNDNFLW